MSDLPPGFTVDAPATQPASATLPSGFAVDPASLPAGFTVDPPVHQAPGFLERMAGIAGRGVVGGLTGLASVLGNPGNVPMIGADTEPGSGRPGDPTLRDGLAAAGESAADVAGAYKPTQVSGKIAQAAISGGTAGLLDPLGALSRVPSIIGGIAGSGGAAATSALGGTDAEATAAGIAAGLLPGGVAAGAGAARSALIGRSASRLTDDQAIHGVLLDDAVKQYAAQGTGNDRLAQQVAGYKKNLANAAGDYAASAKDAGLLDSAGARDIGNAASQANAGTNGLTNAPGSALPTVRALGLPQAHQDALEGALGQLDAASGQQFSRSTAGPVTSLISKLAPVAGYGSAALALYHGNLNEAAGIAGATAVGTHATPALTRIGQAGDRLLGTDVPAFAFNAYAARRAVADRGLQVPQQNPLLGLQDATADNSQLASDNAAAAQAQSDADRAYLYQHADAQFMNRQFDMTQRQQRAYEVSDAGAMDRQITAQQNFERAQQVGDATAIDRQRTRGQTLLDTAGNGLERMQIGLFKKANPGVPVTGAAALSARTPDALFGATDGRFGSPVEPGVQDFSQQQPTGGIAGPSGAPQTGSGGPAPAPTGGPQPGPAPSSPAPLIGPFDPRSAPTGGLRLAQMQHQTQFPGQPVATTEQLQRAATSVFDPQKAFEFASGVNVHPDDAYKVALQHGQSQAPDVSAQAGQDVAAAFGGPSDPNAGARGPILNQTRYKAAVGSYQAHATQMFQLEPSPAGKQAISQIAATPASTDKQAIMDVYKASNPGADLSRFTPQLMKGTN